MHIFFGFYEQKNFDTTQNETTSYLDATFRDL